MTKTMRVFSVMLIVGLLFIVLSGSAYSETYAVASLNYKQGQYKLAYSQFAELASLGNKDAQYAIGVMYLKGHYVEKDAAKAYAWISLSATKGRKNYLDIKKKFKENLNEEVIALAEKEYTLLCQEYGDSAIFKKLGPQLIKNDSAEYVWFRILKKIKPVYPKQAARERITGSVFLDFIVAADGRVKYPQVIGRTYKALVDSSLDAIKKFLYEPTKISGFPVDAYGATMSFSYRFEEMTIREQHLHNLLKELKNKAVNGTSYDSYRYARTARTAYRWINKESRDEFRDTTKYFSKAAVDGLPQAKFELGRSVMYGEQCQYDFDKSYFWLASAAKDGLPEAQFMLGLERISGARYKPDKVAGLMWLEKAAGQRYIPAQIELATALTLVDNDELRDVDRAVKLLKKIKVMKVIDKISFYEAQALVYGVAQNDKAKAKALKRLQKEAKVLGLPFEVLKRNIENRLYGNSIEPLSNGEPVL